MCPCMCVKDKMPGREFSFWKWFWANMNLVKNYVCEEWKGGWVCFCLVNSLLSSMFRSFYSVYIFLQRCDRKSAVRKYLALHGDSFFGRDLWGWPLRLSWPKMICGKYLNKKWKVMAVVVVILDCVFLCILLYMVCYCGPSEMFQNTGSITLHGHDPPSGLRGWQIDPLRFLAGCHKRQLNQALSVLSLIIGFAWACSVMFSRVALIVLCYFIYFYVWRRRW